MTKLDELLSIQRTRDYYDDGDIKKDRFESLKKEIEMMESDNIKLREDRDILLEQIKKIEIPFILPSEHDIRTQTDIENQMIVDKLRRFSDVDLEECLVYDSDDINNILLEDTWDEIKQKLLERKEE